LKGGETVKDSDKMTPLLEIAKRLKQEKSDGGKLARWVIRMNRKFRKMERQEQLNMEAVDALRNFQNGIITREELDQKFRVLELILKKPTKRLKKNR
jgi:hypothetical protein